VAAPLTTVDQLVDEAATRAGPFPGAVPFLDNLERLVRSCEQSAALNPTGRDVLRRVAVRHLRNLRQLQDFVAARPEVAARPLAAPVVVTGLPRTGTTLLHNLLALDPGHRVLRLWEALHPVPADGGGPSVAERQAQAQRWLDGFHRLAPGFRAIHWATVTGPEECDALLQNAFASQHFDDMFDAEEYSTWLGGASLKREYAHYALQLRALTAPGPRWVLKSPGHLGHLDALLAALPGCTVVVCHRDPREAVASYASLIETLRRAYSDEVDAVAVGRQALTRAARAMARALDVRDTTGDARFVDVSYPRLVAHPVEVMRDLYAALDRPFHAGVKQQTQTWVADHPQHASGPHRYDLTRFGLTDAAVDEAFARYTDRFGPLTAG
jgi:hypothetical protein